MVSTLAHLAGAAALCVWEAVCGPAGVVFSRS